MLATITNLEGLLPCIVTSLQVTSPLTQTVRFQFPLYLSTV